MLYIVDVDADLTISHFGYHPESLHPGSPKPVMVICTGCRTTLRREFRASQKKHACPVVKDGQKRCYKCEQWKILAEFNPVRNGSGGVAKLCKVCRAFHPAVQKAARTQYNRITSSISGPDPTRYLKYRIRHVISRAKSLSLSCDIDYDYMLTKWEKQRGLCYYSALVMCGSAKNGRAVWNSPSIDKLIPSLGYIKGNVVWCLMAVNAFKGDLIESEFKEVLRNANWQTDQICDSVPTADRLDVVV